MEQPRDFSTVSPSAKWVLMMKGHTSIPYARQTAQFISESDQDRVSEHDGDMRYWGRTLHFEARYKSIDLLLQEEPLNNILELSGGYSLRGLDYVQRMNAHYIDTDLPDMIKQKNALTEAVERNGPERKGKLELAPLNVLDEVNFGEIADRFPPGPLAIINEGLLIYLNKEEKKILCRNVKAALQKRGGYWITADIYLKFAQFGFDMGLDQQMQKFFDDHQVEENRFDSFAAAEAFFNEEGFVIEKEAEVDYMSLSVFPRLLETIPEDKRKSPGAMPKLHATWKLRLAA